MCLCKEGNNGVSLECASSVWAQENTPGVWAYQGGYYSSVLHRPFLGLTPRPVSLGARSHLRKLREDKSSRTHSGCMTNSLNVDLLTPNYALSSS